jgi:hypothetical protein
LSCNVNECRPLAAGVGATAVLVLTCWLDSTMYGPAHLAGMNVFRLIHGLAFQAGAYTRPLLTSTCAISDPQNIP